MRKILSLLVLTVGCGLLAASALASAPAAPPANTFRWSLSVDIEHVDPALAYYVPSWALEYASGAMLFNYPDAPAPRGSRLVPEVALGFPKISRDGRLYTIRLKRTFRLSDGRRVTAGNFIAAFRRARNPRMRSPASSFLDDVVSFKSAGPYVLQIRMKGRAADLVARLAIPFFMAIPTDLRANPNGIEAPVVSAGPYFIREWTKFRRIILERNSFYRGPRPHRVQRIEVDIGLPHATIKLNIDSGATDTGDLSPSQHAELGMRYGIKRRSPGRYFTNPAPTILYLALNHDRPLFGGPAPVGNLPLKKAVNFAIDRTAMLWQHGGAHAGVVHDQLLPRTMPGFRDVSIYPRRPNLARAQALAKDNLRGGQAIMHCANRPPGPQVCQIVQANLKQIGLNVDIRSCRRCEPLGRRGDAVDIHLEGSHADYFDPYDFLHLVDGTTIPPSGNVNFSYFNHPIVNRRIHQARALTGTQRYRAFGALDVDLMRNAAPIAVYGTPNDRHYVSARTGCYHYHPVYTYDLLAICLKR